MEPLTFFKSICIVSWKEEQSCQEMADLATLHERGESCGDGRLNRRAGLYSLAALREAHLRAVAHCAVQDQVATASSLCKLVSFLV